MPRIAEKKLTIVVSGLPGAGSTTVAKELAKKLKLKLFVAGKLQKQLIKGWKKRESKAAIESWKTDVGSSYKTHRDRDKLQIEIAKKGNVVICSKLGIHFLKNITSYKIWLDVPLKVRAKRVAERDNISIEQAEKEILEREKIERKEWKKMYGFDYFKQKNDADLVLDSSDLTVKQTVERILEFIKDN